MMGKDKIALYLEEIGNFLSKLAEKSDNVYWLSSPDFKKIQYISPAYEAIWGRSRKELYENPELWLSFLHPDDALKKHPIHDMANKVSTEGLSARLSEEYRIIRPDGEIRWIMDRGFPIYNKGLCCGVTGVAVDITREKNYESELIIAKKAADTASQTKSEFIANMSHDIRTPMTGILGLTQELIDSADETQASLQTAINRNNHESLLKDLIDKIQENGQILIDSADELLQLLNEILETMRLESGKVHEEAESFDLRELIKHNIKLMEPIAHHKQLELSAEINEQIPLYFKGFRHYLDRTILNLLSNALKFTEKGSVRLKIELLKENHASPQPGDLLSLKITVEDTGIGIPEDKFTTIFDHFSRLTPSYQGIYKGAGLGLYTVKRYLEAMQAEINVESTVGKGSRFIMLLPLTVSDHSAREKISYQRPKLKKLKPLVAVDKTSQFAKDKAPLAILIVEDNLAAAKAVQANLKHLSDCYSEIAENGREAIKKVQEREYDLILMDIGLPDIDGIEVTKQLRALNHKASKVPILALTGHGADLEIKEKALRAGMLEVFTKPLQMSKLEVALKRYVYHHKQDESTFKPTPKSSQNQNKIIDWEGCVLKMNGDEDCVLDLLTILSSDLKMTKEKLDRAYFNHDTQALRDELHRARGGVVYLVLPELDKSLARFHEAVKAKPQNDQEMEKTYKQLQIAMAQFWETCTKLH